MRLAIVCILTCILACILLSTLLLPIALGKIFNPGRFISGCGGHMYGSTKL